MKKPENTTAIWIRAKLRANQPFLLDELTPSGLKLSVALGWTDDRFGYRAAKKKVADRVPARDWSLVDPEGPESCPQKSEEIDSGKNKGSYLFVQKSAQIDSGKNKGSSLFPQKSEEIDSGETRGRSKQSVAISANGMKHLLAHVPDQELANAWLQYLIDAEHKLRLFREATDRDELTGSHKKNHGAVIDRHGVKRGQSMIAIANNTVFDKSKQGMQSLVKDTKDLKSKPENINPWDHATSKTMAVKDVLAGNLKLAAQYATGQTTVHQVANVASNATLNAVELISGGADIIHVPKSKGNGHRRCVAFEVREGLALPPARAKQEMRKDTERRKAERELPQQELF